jgi:DNA-binding MarR family transcriptional regulator
MSEGPVLVNGRDNGRRPIGYWLKRADEVITLQVNLALRSEELTRHHWQALNLVHQAEVITREQLLEEMRDLVDAAELDDILDELDQRGWIVRRPRGAVSELEITEAGREGHARVLRIQDGLRRRAVQGVSEEEYATALRVLERIVVNLDSDRPGQR